MSDLHKSTAYKMTEKKNGGSGGGGGGGLDPVTVFDHPAGVQIKVIPSTSSTRSGGAVRSPRPARKKCRKQTPHPLLSPLQQDAGGERSRSPTPPAAGQDDDEEEGQQQQGTRKVSELSPAAAAAAGGGVASHKSSLAIPVAGPARHDNDEEEEEEEGRRQKDQERNGPRKAQREPSPKRGGGGSSSLSPEAAPYISRSVPAKVTADLERTLTSTVAKLKANFERGPPEKGGGGARRRQQEGPEAPAVRHIPIARDASPSRGCSSSLPSSPAAGRRRNVGLSSLTPPAVRKFGSCVSPSAGLDRNGGGGSPTLLNQAFRPIILDNLPAAHHHNHHNNQQDPRLTNNISATNGGNNSEPNLPRIFATGGGGGRREVSSLARPPRSPSPRPAAAAASVTPPPSSKASHLGVAVKPQQQRSVSPGPFTSVLRPGPQNGGGGGSASSLCPEDGGRRRRSASRSPDRGGAGGGGGFSRGQGGRKSARETCDRSVASVRSVSPTRANGTRPGARGASVRTGEDRARADRRPSLIFVPLRAFKLWLLRRAASLYVHPLRERMCVCARLNCCCHISKRGEEGGEGGRGGRQGPGTAAPIIISSSARL